MTAGERAAQIVRISSDGRIAVEVLQEPVLGRNEGVSLISLTCIAEPYGTFLRKRIELELKAVEVKVERRRHDKAMRTCRHCGFVAHCRLCLRDHIHKEHKSAKV